MYSAHGDRLRRDAMVVELMRPVAALLARPGVTELVINRPGEVWIELGAQWERHAVEDLTPQRLMSIATAVATFASQQISAERPLLSAMLPGGERVQFVIPPAVEPNAFSMTVRRPGSGIKSLDEYEAEGVFSGFTWGRSELLDASGGAPHRTAGKTAREDLESSDQELVTLLENNQLGAFLRGAVEARKTLAVVGDTGSGKTTLMKALCQHIPLSERLISIEDARELMLPQHGNRVHLLYSQGGQGVAKVLPADLIRACMRMKPDRVLMAELRGGEAFDFLKLLTTGHSGSITSYHAESCALALERYVLMTKEHEQAAIYDAEALKRLVALTIDVIVLVVAEIRADGPGGTPRKHRHVREVHFDPVAKLAARFGAASLHRG